MRRPSAAAEVIPPAYPQPSPQGYTPEMPSASKFSPRRMRTGELVRDSTPVNTPRTRKSPKGAAPYREWRRGETRTNRGKVGVDGRKGGAARVGRPDLAEVVALLPSEEVAHELHGGEIPAARRKISGALDLALEGDARQSALAEIFLLHLHDERGIGVLLVAGEVAHAVDDDAPSSDAAGMTTPPGTCRR